ncbi:hypothetical protein CABS01_01969 [Colletotrichum abscissum]|uniref:Amidohydrolase-related domain-containing protein n=1 Tax=Colletotrichum abscissum TaxID=1671311 RepID=A0A9P9X9T2_9PEZI|nr:uncharacterized protein CABS01_01969 [Colletotrichum abscissum]KAI3544592.1 hypothetical protein CABS02_09700 [Colletotrichum abscissum]KAK1488339.1 hypothetical protein CABS01_01969 [Colletotrichum abscissum]
MESSKFTTARSNISPDSWDTHVHVFDASIGPFAPGRSYTPARATAQQLLDFSSSLTRATPLNIVLVQPSPYGSDNTVLLRSLKSLREGGSRIVRGIAVVDIEKISDANLMELHDAGVRGLRINKQADGKSTNLDALKETILQTASRIQYLPGWKIQLFCAPAMWEDLYDTIVALPVQVIADHVGGMRALSKLQLNAATSSLDDPTKQPGFEALVKLARASKVIVKLSGFYRLSDRTESGCDDMEPIVKALVEAVPHRLVWGSDWPHTGEGKDRVNRGLEAVEEFREIDDVRIIQNLRSWVEDEKAWMGLMVQNPAGFYA